MKVILLIFSKILSENTLENIKKDITSDGNILDH